MWNNSGPKSGVELLVLQASEAENRLLLNVLFDRF